MADRAQTSNSAPMHAHTQALIHAHRVSRLMETKGNMQTHPDVLIMESHNEDKETPSGQADGAVDN